MPLRFANGGMLSQGATTFALSDGRFGVFGEAGPELGFFPLKRGKDGKMGVQAETTGGPHNVSNTTVVNMNVKAEDPNAFRQSAAQLVADATRSARLRR